MASFKRRPATILPAALAPMIVAIVLLRGGPHAEGYDFAAGLLFGVGIGLVLVAARHARGQAGC